MSAMAGSRVRFWTFLPSENYGLIFNLARDSKIASASAVVERGHLCALFEKRKPFWEILEEIFILAIATLAAHSLA